jgi:HEAT repeat protein
MASMARLIGWWLIVVGCCLALPALAAGAPIEDKVGFLSEKIKDPSSFKVRLKAAVLLGRLADPRAVGPLTEALGDENYVVRGAAARALGNLGMPIAVGSIESVLRLVEDEVPFVRQEAQRALKRLAGEQSADTFIAAMSSSRPAIRLAAILILAGIPTPEARSAVMLGLGDEDDEVRSEAIVAVKGLGAAELEGLLREALGRKDNYQVQATAARLVGELRVLALLDLLADLMVSDAVVPVARKEAELALREMKDRLDVNALVAQLGSTERSVQARAIQLLGLQAGREAVDALMALLRHADPYMRQRAVFALGDAGDARAIPALEFLLKSENDARFRKLIERTLRKLRP